MGERTNGTLRSPMPVARQAARPIHRLSTAAYEFRDIQRWWILMLLNRAFVGPHDRQRRDQDRRKRPVTSRSCLLINNRRIPGLWRIFVVAPNLIAADKTSCRSAESAVQSVLRCHKLSENRPCGRVFYHLSPNCKGEGLDGGERGI